MGNQTENKPSWWKEPIDGSGSTCICCGNSAKILDLKTKLYFDFGGWNVLKNGGEFFCDNRTNINFEDCYDLAYIESLIGDDDENEYVAQFHSAMRDAIYQRHAKNVWVLIRKGDGFA